MLTNTTAAASAAQQWSPRIHFDGRGWETTGPASQAVDIIEELQPVQCTTNPTGGAVGIGSTAPVEKLDVAGTIKVAGTGSEACSSSTVGQMRYNPAGQYMEICTYP